MAPTQRDTAVSIRAANAADIAGMQRVRRAVRENVLSDPSRVSDADVEAHLSVRGRGWVAVREGQLVGFAIGRTEDANIWALFVDPDWAGQGIGARLHDTMVEALFASGLQALWLTTEPGTRAEGFYRARGWAPWPPHPPGELRLRLDAGERRNRPG